MQDIANVFAHRVSVIVLCLTCVLLMGAGERYSKQGHALGKKVYSVLIEEGYCADMNDCYRKEVMFGEDGNRVNLNLYGIKDRKIISAVVMMVVRDGLAVTDGVSIAISVYDRSKSDYLGFKSFTQKPFIKLEVSNP